MRFEDKDALARAVAALYAKPFLRLMDDNYKEEDSFIQNMNRIAKAEYDRIQEDGFRVSPLADGLSRQPATE